MAAAGALVYLVTLLVVPLVNTDLDPIRLHPEDYASAQLGFLVVVGYAALAVALLALAAITARGGLLGVLAAACFVVAAIVCVANAIDPTLGARRSAIEIGIVGLAVGPLVASARQGRALFALAAGAALAFVALLAVSDQVSGLVNRLFDGLAALWCVAYALARANGRGIMRPSGEVA